MSEYNQFEDYQDSELKAFNLFSESFNDRIIAAEKTLNEDSEYLIYEEEVKRSELPDSVFGIPEDRKYPLDSEKHVRSAIRLFGHCPDDKKKSLARRITSKAKKYNIEIPETTQVYKYAHEANIPKELVFTDRYITEDEIYANDLYELSLLEAEGSNVDHFDVKLYDKNGSKENGKILFNGKEISIEDKSMRDKMPIPLEFFPNNMGINLCSVDSMSWDRQKDGQLININIKFDPADEKTKKEEHYDENIKESIEFINSSFPDLLIEYTILEADEEVQDNVKSVGKPDALSREAVVTALEKAASIPDDKKRSGEIRKVISSTVGKLSAKIKYTLGNLRLYNKEYTYDGYIKEVFPKYIEMLNAKDLYKLKDSIMEHAFTTGLGHKSLSDVINSNQNSTDKENYVLALADRVRKDLSSVLHLIDKLYDKSRFDGVKPYNPKEKEIEPKEEPKVEENNKEDEEDNPIKEKPKKRKSYWDVDVSEEDEAENESSELVTEGFKLPGNARTEITDNLDKIKAKSGVVISKDRAKTESETANYDFKSKGLIPVAFMGDNDYIAYNIAKKKWCKVNTVDGIIFKYSDKLIHTLESADILEEKAKIRSDEPDDAGYYESNIKFRGARVVVCSRYSEEAESRIKAIQKAFKNVEKSYTGILESVAEEIYAEWSRDHGEKVSKEEFTRSIFKSKLQNRIIAMQDQYGYVFEFNYSVNMKVGGTGRLVVNIFTDLDGFVTSYRYSTESTVRKY